MMNKIYTIAVSAGLFALSVADAQTTNAIPFSDSFEGYSSGASLNGTNGWQGGAWVTNLMYTYDEGQNGYPLNDTHTQVMKTENGATNLIQGASASEVWVDSILSADSYWSGPGYPVVDSNATVCVYLNTNGHLVAGHTAYGTSNLVWSEFSEFTIPSNAWNRLTLRMNYQVQDAIHGHTYYMIMLNGVALEHVSGRAEPTGIDAGGPWFPMMGTLPFSGIALDGSAGLDDFSVTEQAPYPTMSVSGPGSLSEGDAGTTTAQFAINLTANTPVPVLVDYSTLDGSASAGADYVATNGTAVIPSGSSSVLVDVSIIGNTNIDADVSFDLVIADPVNALMDIDTASCTILNDDVAPEPPTSIQTVFEYTFDDPADTNSWAISAPNNSIVDIGGDKAWNFTDNGDMGDKSFDPLTNGTITLHFGIANGAKAKLIWQLYDASGTTELVKFNAFKSGESFNIEQGGDKITYLTSETWDVGSNGLGDKGKLEISWSGNDWTSMVTFGSGVQWSTNGTFKADASAGVGLFRYTTAAGNDAYLFDISLGLPVVPVSETAFDAWIGSFELSGSNALMSADADGSGFNNLYEYAFGGNPTNASDNGQNPAHQLISDQIEYTYIRRDDTNLTFTVQVGTNLVSGLWSTNGVSETGTAPFTSNYETVTNLVETVTRSNGFIRVRVDAP